MNPNPAENPFTAKLAKLAKKPANFFAAAPLKAAEKLQAGAGEFSAKKETTPGWRTRL